jgi:hypothetical protein
MAKKEIKDYICRPFCTFYREGEKEELICHGARKIENLLDNGVLDIGELACDRNGFSFPAVRDAVLEAAVCRKCDFRKEDCDFQSEQGPVGAEPCGGYILLCLLIANRVISIYELTEQDDA